MRGGLFFHYFLYKIGFADVWTQLTISERETLIRYSSKSRLALEIGIFEAASTSLIAKNIIDTGKVFAVDPFLEKGILGFSYTKAIALTKLKREGVLDKVTIIEKKSSDAGADIPDNLDFIFIDGDHSLDCIKMDWSIYTKKLKIGGFIALHDVLVPDFQIWKSDMDSVKYFEDVISKDPDFIVLEKVDSLCVLMRAR